MNSYFTANTIHCGCQNIKSVFRALEIYNFGLSHATDFYDMPIFSLFDVFDNQEGVAIAGRIFLAIIKKRVPKL